MNPGTGIKYPKLSIGGKPYELRLSMGAFYRLEEQGLPAQSIAEEIQRWMPEMGKDSEGNEIVVKACKVSVANLFKLLSACIGEQTTLTPAQLADQMDMSGAVLCRGHELRRLIRNRPHVQVIRLPRRAVIAAPHLD